MSTEKAEVSTAVRETLKDVVRKAAEAQKIALRAKAVLLNGAGRSRAAVASSLGVSGAAVSRWLGLYGKGGLTAVLSGRKNRKAGSRRDRALEEKITDLESRLGYKFIDRSLIAQALMHRSCANEMGLPRSASNERLEFLGDSVLGLVLSHELTELRPEDNEGGLSRLRAALVNEQKLSEIAQNAGIGPYLSLGRGEELSGGRDKPSILSDAYEAILAAVYLDGGYEAVRHLVKSHFSGVLKSMDGLAMEADGKSRLQELSQVAFKAAPVYLVVGESGPDHEKIFEVEVRLRGEVLGRGSGRSKREAEQRAAREAERPLREKISALRVHVRGADG